MDSLSLRNPSACFEATRRIYRQRTGSALSDRHRGSPLLDPTGAHPNPQADKDCTVLAYYESGKRNGVKSLGYQLQSYQNGADHKRPLNEVQYEAIVGTPKGRFSLLPGLGIHTRLTACGWY